jgi:hypothetical protein
MNTGLAAMACLAGLVLSACSNEAEPALMDDPSKMSEDLENEARAIEARAQEAVKQAEAAAEADLRRLREEAAASTVDAATSSEADSE